MTQKLEALATEEIERILCCYINATDRIQVARLASEQDDWFERVVFPGQRLLFEAQPEEQLEIHTSQMADDILTDRIRCDRLRVYATLQSS